MVLITETNKDGQLGPAVSGGAVRRCVERTVWGTVRLEGLEQGARRIACVVYVSAGAVTLGHAATATARDLSFLRSSPGEFWRPQCRETQGRKEPNKSRDRMRTEEGPCCKIGAWTELHCESTRPHSLRVHACTQWVQSSEGASSLGLASRHVRRCGCVRVVDRRHDHALYNCKL